MSRFAVAGFALALGCTLGACPEAEQPSAVDNVVHVTLATGGQEFVLSPQNRILAERLFKTLDGRKDDGLEDITKETIKPEHRFSLYFQPAPQDPKPDLYIWYYETQNVLRISGPKQFKVDAELRGQMAKALQWR